jgi:hypothetical protein
MNRREHKTVFTHKGYVYRRAFHYRGDEVDSAYELGVKLSEKYSGDLKAAIYGEDIDYIFNDHLLTASWEAGFNGSPQPVWAEGWRLGNIPSAGRSYNYRDNHPEPGVSMMWVKDENGNEYYTEDKLSAAFISRRTKRVYYSGWLVGFGSDGEPCLLR